PTAHDLLETLPSARQMRHHRAEWDLEHLCDRAIGQVFDRYEEQDATLLFRQPTECVQDIIALFVIVPSGVCAEILGRRGPLARALALCWSDEAVAYDGEQPRAGIVVIAACVQMVQGTH